MKTKTFLFFLLCLCMSFSGQAQRQKNAGNKKAQTERQFQAIDSLVKTNRFQIDVDRVFPQKGHDLTRFNPRGFIRIKDSLAKGELPYFGRAYSLPYGEGGGIKFDDKIIKRTVNIQAKRRNQYIYYTFTVNGQNDSYRFSIEISSSGNCTISLTSNNRAFISYAGQISPLREEKQE